MKIKKDFFNPEDKDIFILSLSTKIKQNSEKDSIIAGINF